MGIQEMKDELEELSFRMAAYPEAYETLTAQLAHLRQRNKGIIQTDRDGADRQARRSRHLGKVRSREKKPYSIWRKMENKQISLEQLSDIYGFRVVVDERR